MSFWVETMRITVCGGRGCGGRAGRRRLVGDEGGGRGGRRGGAAAGNGLRGGGQRGGGWRGGGWHGGGRGPRRLASSAGARPQLRRAHPPATCTYAAPMGWRGATR